MGTNYKEVASKQVCGSCGGYCISPLNSQAVSSFFETDME